MTAPPVLVACGQDQLLDHIRAAAAAAGVPVSVTTEPARIRELWTQAGLVLIGVDQAARVAGLALPWRRGVHVVGAEAEVLLGWSAPLGAAALLLPDQAGLLGSLLGDGAQMTPPGNRLSVVAGSGGVGASTLAAALAHRAARKQGGVALVELDPDGAGLDLMMGVEAAPGWRWPDLAGAQGHIGDLRERLPRSGRVDLVACGRERGLPATSGQASTRPTGEHAVRPGSRLGLPPVGAVRAVLASLQRSHRLVVIDHAWEGLPPEGRVLVVVAADPRGVLAARARLARLGLTGAGLVVRQGPGRRLEPQLIAEILQLPVLGRIGHHRRLPLAAELGDPPGRQRDAFARQVDALLAEVGDD